MVEMKRWTAALDAACAWVNPVLAVVAFGLAVLDVAAVGQSWTLAHPQASVAAKTVAVAVRSDGCSPPLPPELRDMIGRD
jgi:hypothetical protein